MEVQFENSIEASNIMLDIQRELATLPSNRDLHILFGNLTAEVDKLSRVEVSVRRNPTVSITSKYQQQKQDLFAHIKMLRNYLLIARLMA